MPRKPRELKPEYCYHITVRCNNREFKLNRRECREVLLFAIKKAQEKFRFKLYALCIMSNHTHYMLEPEQPEHLPKIMHWLNWYTAMCFNRMLNRTGHFWEKRYYSSGFEKSDYQRALNTLRYIHANPKSAQMQRGFFYDFSNYGIYDRLGDDGLTQWHPAFLKLGKTLDECANRYRGFCRKYKPQAKSQKRSHWGSKLLAGIQLTKKSKTRKKSSPGQLSFPWDLCQVSENPQVKAVSEKFINANSYNAEFIQKMQKLHNRVPGIEIAT